MRRRITAVVLIVVGVLLAVAGAEARRLGDRVERSRVTIGDSTVFAPNLGNEESLTPFAFGVVGPVRGSTGALERAFDELHELGGVEFVVLLGDVTTGGSESELLGLVATWQAAGVERIAVAGPDDLADAAEFEAYVSPLRWWFRRNGCLFVGVSGVDGDADFTAKAAGFATDTTPVFGFAPAASDLVGLVPSVAFEAHAADDADTVSVRRVELLGGGAHVVVSRNVSRAPTLRSLYRSVLLGVLRPLVRGAIGFALVLLVCTAFVGTGLSLLRARRAAQTIARPGG